MTTSKPDTLKLKRSIRSLWDFLRHLRPFWRSQVSLALIAMLRSLTFLLLPLFGQRLVDNALLVKNFSNFLWIGSSSALVAGFSFALGIQLSFLNMRFKTRAGFSIRKKLAQVIERIPLNSFNSQSSADCLFRLSNRLDFLCEFALGAVEQACTLLAQLAFITIVLFWINSDLAAIMLVLFALNAAGTLVLVRRRQQVELMYIEATRGAFRQLGQLLGKMYIVKALREERYALRGYVRRLIVQSRMRVKRWRLDILNRLLGQSLGFLVLGVATLIGSYWVVSGRITAGALTAFLAYLGSLRPIKSNLFAFANDLYLSANTAHELHEFLSAGLKNSAPATAKGPIIKQTNITFRDVSFGYNDGNAVVERLSFAMPAKGVLALVGASGCGKTTILNLLLGLYRPWNGQVSIGLLNVSDIPDATFRKQIAIVPQQPFLWHDTIENNIKFGRPNASRAEIVRAASLVGINDYVRALPHGYDTNPGENACRLSEGQKQKLAIARALVRGPRILILDEAMSSMDARNEQLVLSSVRSLPIDLVLVVSHRLSSIKSCDSVFFLKDSRQMVDGSFEELLKSDEEFYALFAGQLMSRDLMLPA